MYSLYFASFRCIKYSKMVLFSSAWPSPALLLLLWGTEINKNTLRWSHHSVWIQRQGWEYDLVLILMDGCKLHLAVTAEELFPVAGRWKFEMATAGVGMSLGNPTVTKSSMGPRAPDIFKSLLQGKASLITADEINQNDLIGNAGMPDSLSRSSLSHLPIRVICFSFWRNRLHSLRGSRS